MALVGNPVETLSIVSASAVSSPAAETAIVTTDPIIASAPPPAAPGGTAPFVTRPVTIRVSLNVTAGTGTTAWVTRCRQGSGVGGAQVGAAMTDSLAATNFEQASYVFRDTSPLAGASPYTITVAQTGNTVAGTVNAIDVEVTQL